MTGGGGAESRFCFRWVRSHALSAELRLTGVLASLPQVTTGASLSSGYKGLSVASMWTFLTSREITLLGYQFKQQTWKKVPSEPCL